MNKVPSVVRHIRLSRNVDEILVDEAKRRNISLNQLASSILSKYCEWDRFAEKFSYVHLPGEFYKELFNLLPEAALEEFGIKTGRMFREAIYLWCKDLSVQSFLEYISLQFKYTWGSLVQYDQRIDGKKCVVTMHHGLGRKWSNGCASFSREAVKDTLGIDPKIVCTDNMVAITIPMAT